MPKDDTEIFIMRTCDCKKDTVQAGSHITQAARCVFCVYFDDVFVSFSISPSPPPLQPPHIWDNRAQA